MLYVGIAVAAEIYTWFRASEPQDRSTATSQMISGTIIKKRNLCDLLAGDSI